MIIKNAMVFQEDGTFLKKDIYVEKGFLVSREEEVTDKIIKIIQERREKK